MFFITEFTFETFLRAFSLFVSKFYEQSSDLMFKSGNGFAYVQADRTELFNAKISSMPLWLVVLVSGNWWHNNQSGQRAQQSVPPTSLWHQPLGRDVYIFSLIAV